MAADNESREFLSERSCSIDALIQALKQVFELREEHKDTSALDMVEAEWNEGLEKVQATSDAQRAELANDYRWYQTLERRHLDFHEQLDGFLGRCRERDYSGYKSTELARLRESIARDRIGLVVSDVSSTIRVAMPNQVRQARKGVVNLTWSGNADASIHWEGGGATLRLRSTIQSACRLSGNMEHGDVEFFAPALIHEIRNVHGLSLPQFEYPPTLQADDPPEWLDWQRESVSLTDRSQLPWWIREVSQAPEKSPPRDLVQEAEIVGSEKLAELVDATLCAAARQDYARSLSGADSSAADRQEILQALIDEVARAAGASPSDVLQVLLPVMAQRQRKTRSPEECAANTGALRFLLSELSE